MNARDADEGRSVFSQRGGGNRLSEKLFQDGITIFTDPGDPVAPEWTFGDEGLPQRRTVWVRRGFAKPHSFALLGAGEGPRARRLTAFSTNPSKGPRSSIRLVRSFWNTSQIVRFELRVLGPLLAGDRQAYGAG